MNTTPIVQNTPRALVSSLLLCAALVTPLASYGATHSAQSAVDWQPVASEKLIRMPAKYMDASIESHYQKSALASSINGLDAQVQMEVARMQESQQAMANAEGEQAQLLQQQFLTAKSNYLELMHEKHQLTEKVLTKKAALYQKIMKKLQRKKGLVQDPVSVRLVAKQQAARQRLNKASAQVDALLLQQTPGATSQYQLGYSENLAKIEQLKVAIQQKGNDSPVLDGQALTREQYLRHLISGVDSALATLDQERLMLGYMAKLVAMGAQALEHEIAYGAPDEAVQQVKQQVRLVNTVDLFINP